MLHATGWMLRFRETEEARLDLPEESIPRPVDAPSVILQDRHGLVLSSLDVLRCQVGNLKAEER